MKKMFVIWVSLFMVIGLFVLPVHALSKIENDGFSYFVESEFEKTHYPGMAIQIVSSDEILFNKTYGDVQSLDDGFVIGSLSKSLTAVCVMQLVERNKIDLDEQVKNYLSELKIKSSVTVRQFLNQNSGVGPYDTIENFNISDDNMNFVYSNVNYTILAMIIEKVTGESYSSYIKENIFLPLEMNKSFTNIEEAKQSGIAKGHQSFFGFMLGTKHNYPNEKYSGRLSVPAAYIISSSNDMAKYMQFYLNKHNSILSSESLDKMINESIDTNYGFRYGMGLGTTTSIFENEFTIYHSGSVENYNTTMIILPQKDIAIITMFDGADYFVSNHISENITMEILGKYLGISPNIEKSPSYVSSHLIINIILFIILMLSMLPTIFYLCKKTENSKYRIIKDTVIHFILPVCIWILFIVSGMTPAAILDTRKFMPDVFIILILSCGILVFTGILKIFVSLKNKKQSF